MTREKIIQTLRIGYVLLDGNRNNDAVDLAIVAYDDADGKIECSDQLNDMIRELIDEEKLPVNSRSDFEYLEEKCEVLMDYLPGWYNSGDIYSYAII